MRDLLKKIDSRHRRMMHALVIEGMTAVEVEIKFEITKERLGILRRSPLWIAEEKKLREEYLDHFKTDLCRLLPKAINVAEATLDSENEMLAHKAAMDIMDRNRLTGELEVSVGGGISIRVVLDD